MHGGDVQLKPASSLMLLTVKREWHVSITASLGESPLQGVRALLSYHVCLCICRLCLFARSGLWIRFAWCQRLTWACESWVGGGRWWRLGCRFDDISLPEQMVSAAVPGEAQLEVKQELLVIRRWLIVALHMGMLGHEQIQQRQREAM